MTGKNVQWGLAMHIPLWLDGLGAGSALVILKLGKAYIDRTSAVVFGINTGIRGDIFVQGRDSPLLVG